MYTVFSRLERDPMPATRQEKFWWKHALPQERDTISVRAKVDPVIIGLLNGLVDAHDGIACLRTTDPKAGKLEFWVSPNCLDDFQIMLKGLREVADVEIENEENLPYQSAVPNEDLR